ncbi:MAG: colicin V production protein [Hirschia sp.]|nr:colicin V production protein [Hirschia sp.]MBF20040.1 colicin V production protein [Hirschia sp.]|tara:strand:+ start:249 stop:824 length:576 start_codon:yes stop_codon:yes gene_type:complete
MDSVQTSFTAFDVIVVMVIVVSAIMSLSRGLVRETSSIISFLAGIVAAYAMLLLFRDPVRNMVPESWPLLTGDAILVVVSFILVYLLAAGIGQQLSRLIKSTPEIGLIDRIAGAIFGGLRGALAVVLFVLLMHMVIPEETTPSFIAKSKLYPYANGAATWLTQNFPGFVEKAQDSIPPLEPSGTTRGLNTD